MSEVDLQQLRRRMGEVAALESDDPERQAVVRQIAEAGPALEREWLDLLEEQERLRLALFRIDPPAGLHDSLRRIPRESPRRRTFRLALVGSTLAAAAAVVLTVSLLITNPAAPTEPNRFAQVADLTVERHLAGPAVTIQSPDYETVEQALGGHLPYPTRIPSLGTGFQLIGGGKITLEGKPVVYTQWRHEGKVCSLYQLCPSDFNLPADFDRQVVDPATRTIEEGAYRVTFWFDNHCVYALVAPSPAGAPTPSDAIRASPELDSPPTSQRRVTPDTEATRALNPSVFEPRL